MEGSCIIVSITRIIWASAGRGAVGVGAEGDPASPLVHEPERQRRRRRRLAAGPGVLRLPARPWAHLVSGRACLGAAVAAAATAAGCTVAAACARPGRAVQRASRVRAPASPGCRLQHSTAAVRQQPSKCACGHR